VPYTKELHSDFLPASLGSQDYPALVGPRPIDTVAVSAVSHAYNWRRQRIAIAGSRNSSRPSFRGLPISSNHHGIRNGSKPQSSPRRFRLDKRFEAPKTGCCAPVRRCAERRQSVRQVHNGAGRAHGQWLSVGVGVGIRPLFLEFLNGPGARASLEHEPENGYRFPAFAKPFGGRSKVGKDSWKFMTKRGVSL